MEYKLAIAGGTFDRLHAGHKAFLQAVFFSASEVILGVTSDEYAKQKNQNIQPFEERMMGLKAFLKEERVETRVKIVEIYDIYGVLLDRDIKPDVLFVTDDTKEHAEEINKKRQEIGLSKIPMRIVPLIFSDDQQIVSSTAIRQGEMNAEGEKWIKTEWLRNTLLLPEGLREDLAKPFGVIVSGIPDVDPWQTITVGDETTRLFNQKNIHQAISVVDFLVERNKKYSSLVELGFGSTDMPYSLQNAPGHVDQHVWVILASVLKKSLARSIIQVDGEEDLLVLPVVLLAPLGYNVFYGQPGQGLVWIQVDESTKQHAYDILSRFVIAN